MEYVKDCDYKYIMNKYHRQDQPFNAHRRFVRHDEYFSPASGLSPEEIYAGIRQQDMRYAHCPHVVRKAHAFAYILGNTRISCDKRDLFPAINMVDRPLNNTLIADWKKELLQERIPQVNARISNYNKSGSATIWPDFDHSVPFWDLVFDLGFAGILQKAKQYATEEHADFYEGISITYCAIIDFIGRLEQQALIDGNTRMAAALNTIKAAPPKSFYEALLADYLYFMLSEHIEGLQVRSLGHFDRLFYKFYRSDLENGVSEEAIRTDLAYFLLQFTAIGNYWNQPVFLGGCKEDESTLFNELSYLFLDVYDRMGIYNPKVQLRIADSTPKDLILKALDMIRRGSNSIVFVNDATIRKAMENAGYTPEQARLANIKGCYEYAPQSTLDTGMNYINLLKPLEYTLHKGCDGVTGQFCGLESPEGYTCFADFFNEYKRQLLFLIDGVINAVNDFEDYLSFISPQSILSATYESCLKKGRDALCGGAESNDSYMFFGGIADAADSLAILKKYVFERKLLSLSRLTEILDRDFEGEETLRMQLLADRDKYGNNKDLPDELVKELVDLVCRHVIGRANAKMRAGCWTVGFHVARQSYEQGVKTAATPNGRRKGAEFSKNLSASMGMNREGATAAILSVTKIDATAFPGDACLDLGLLPSAVQGDDGLQAMYGLLATFLKRGGHALHINIFDAETLRAAQKEPEKYADLQIRVSGWNVLWNNISKEEQDGFIRQAEALQ